MNQTPHKHADIIKAWADGAEVEYKMPGLKEFHHYPTPSFNGTGEYRIKPAPDKWADLKAAHKAGSEIQYRNRVGDGAFAEWEDANFPMWLNLYGDEYRIKPHDEYAELNAAVEAGKSMQTRLDKNDPWIDANNHIGFIWNLGATNYRVKPETLTYRVAILQYKGCPPYACICASLGEEQSTERLDCFVRWAGERQEVEV